MREKYKPVRSDRHLKFVASLPCLVTGMMGMSEAHHLLRGPIRGMGMKAGDEWCIPLAYHIHRELHHNGNETKFLSSKGIHDAKHWAEKIYEYSRVNDYDGAVNEIMAAVREKRI